MYVALEDSKMAIYDRFIALDTVVYARHRRQAHFKFTEIRQSLENCTKRYVIRAEYLIIYDGIFTQAIRTKAYIRNFASLSGILHHPRRRERMFGVIGFTVSY